MISDDERREVARKLREYARCEGAECLVYCESFGETVLNLFTGKCGESFRANYEYLAGLIDPEPERTCHVVPMDAAGNPPYRKSCLILNEMSDGCSECGYPFDTANKGRPNYCPNCGAKVVDE